MASGLNIGELFVRMSGDVTQLRKDMNEARGIVANGAKQIQSALRTIGIAFSAGLVLKKFIDETSEAQKAQAQLAAVLKSTGGAAGKTMGQLDALAQSLQATTTYSDEAVSGVESLLLTFTQIRGANFDQAVKTILDMSTALGQDLKSSAIQVGKALNDPIKGITALQRVGVSFNQTQKDTIANLVKSGRVAEAQALILKELQAEFGGSAVAARDTLGGALEALNHQWGELFEGSRESSDGIIAAINGISDALPTVKAAMNAFLGGIAILGADAAVGVARLEVGLIRLGRLNPVFAFTDADNRKQAEAIANLDRMKVAAEEVKMEMFGFGKAAETAGKGAEGAADHTKDFADQVERLNKALKEKNDLLPSAADIAQGAERSQGIRDQITAGDIASVADDFMKEAAAKFGKNFKYPTPPIGTAKSTIGTEIRAKPGGALDPVTDALGDFAGSALSEATAALEEFSPAALGLSAAFEILKGVMEPLEPILDIVANLLQSVGNVLGGVLQPILKAVAKVFTYIIQAVGYFVEGLGIAIDKLVPDAISKVGKGLTQQGKDLVANAKAQREALDAVVDATEYIGGLGDAAQRTAEALSNVPDIWNANLARFRAARSAASGTSSAAPTLFDVVPSQGGAAFTFTGNIVLPGVKNAPDFYREVATEAVRVTARGGSPVLIDATQRRVV